LTHEQARVWIRWGAWLAIGIGTVDLLIWLSRNSADLSSPFRYVTLADGVFLFVLAAGVRRHSRVAAGGLLGYWVFSKGHQIATSGRLIGPLIGLLVLGWVFINVLRATFVMHRRTDDVLRLD
jgi:hypothetical protein